MSNLDPTKRKQLIGLAIGVVCFVALTWYLIIRQQYNKLQVQQKKIAGVVGDIEKAKLKNRMLDQFEGEFKVSQGELQRLEDRMAPGDAYRWMLHVFEELQTSNHVSALNIDPPRIAESEIPPQVAYRTATFLVSGIAYYHDFGVFLAALENGLPFLRLQKLELKRASFVDTGTEEKEQLSFTMELLTLAKVPPTQP
jgi:hypothetical protein